MRLIFPVPPTVAAAAVPSRIALDAPLPMRVLIVDDDPVLLKSLRDTTEDDGHTIVTATGGQEGIDIFRAACTNKESFAVVITDLGMPYVDGRAVASAVKAASPTAPGHADWLEPAHGHRE